MDKDKCNHRSEELLKVADRLIERIKKADEVDVDKIDLSYREVMQKVQASKNKNSIHIRHIYGWIASIAAVIAIVVISSLWLTEERASTNLLDVALLDRTSLVSDKEVTLITDENTINLEDKALLKYDKAGVSNAEKYALKRVEQPAKTEGQMHQIIVPHGRRASVTLADGSKIFINSGSKVIYPERFDSKQREILIEGEVYLEVAKNINQPFVVKTRGFDVQVLGTSFNVCAYQDDEEASVVLVNGSVGVTTNTKNSVALQPNEKMSLCNNKVDVHKVNVAEYISWKDDMMIISDKPLYEVFKRLERYYGYKIHFSPEIADISLSGKLDLQPSIQHVMDNICLMIKVKYSIDDKKEIAVSLK